MCLVRFGFQLYKGTVKTSRCICECTYVDFFFIVNILALVEYNISFVATTNVVFVVGFSLFSHLSTYYFSGAAAAAAAIDSIRS